MTQSSAASPQPAQQGPYDVVVIGAGPGGYIAAFRAAQNGLKAAVVEREWTGGVCLNVGCIPSKALLRNAEVVRTLKDAKTYGVTVGEFKADYGAAVDRSRQVVGRIVKGLEFLFRKHKVDLIKGEAKLVAKDTIDVGGRQIKTKHIIVATGARPRLFPGIEVDGERVMHIYQFIVDKTFPEKIAIVGGGVIGCEMATVLHSYGAEVTIVEAADAFLAGREDPRITQLLQRSFEKQGIKILLGAKVEAAKADGKKAKVTYSKDGKSETLEVDRALICIAMQPNTENLGLEQLGVELDRGYVKVDERMATNVPGIWAIGDVAATRYGLAHVASAEGHLAADAIAGHHVRPLNYNNMPRPVFCYPQVAFIGMTEAQAKEAGYEVKVGEFPFSALGKAVAENDFEGVVRLIVDAKYGEILGCHIIGPEATELLAQVTPYKVLEGTSREMIDTVVSHPTLSESIKLAAALAEGESLEI